MTRTATRDSRSSGCTLLSTRSRRWRATSPAAPRTSVSPTRSRMDNAFSTWTNYRNRYWPAEYLIDQQGIVRHVKFGEGGYDETEKLIRQLLSQGARTSPPAVDAQDITPTGGTHPGDVLRRRQGGELRRRRHVRRRAPATFASPAQLPDDSFALSRPVGARLPGHYGSDTDDNAIALSYHARNVYMVVGGTGTVTVKQGRQDDDRFRSAGRPTCVSS